MSMGQEKDQLIENIKLVFAYSKHFELAWIDSQVTNKVIIYMEKNTILQDEMDDLIETFGNHAGMTYKIQADVLSYLNIEITLH